jgi:hypothetical protein
MRLRNIAQPPCGDKDHARGQTHQETRFLTTFGFSRNADPNPLSRTLSRLGIAEKKIIFHNAAELGLDKRQGQASAQLQSS